MHLFVNQLLYASLVIFFCSCDFGKDKDQLVDQPFIYVLGVAQDGGYPQAGCLKKCCIVPKNKPELRRWISSIAIVDNISEWNNVLPPLKKIHEPQNHKSVLILNELEACVIDP